MDLKFDKYFQHISLLAILLASIFSVGFHHFDEHFQLLEFANFKLGNITSNQLPWEFHDQIRPSSQISIIYGLQLFLGLLGINNPFTICFILRLLSGLLTFFVLKQLFEALKLQFKSRSVQKLFAFFMFLTWFIVYNGVRFSSENWSALFFVLGFCLYSKYQNTNWLKLLLIGFLFGFAFNFRFQTALMTVGFLAWITVIKKEKIQSILLIIFGGMLALGIGASLDYWLYSELTFSPFNYFLETIMAGNDKGFEEMPFYWYFTRFLEQGIPPLSLLYILGTLYFIGKQPKSLISWIIIPFLLAHFVIPHKELRFLFPIVYFLPFILVKAIDILPIDHFKVYQHRFFKIIMKLGILTNLIFLVIVCFRPADPNIGLYKTVYDKFKEPTTLYVLKDNPFIRVLPVNYYKRNSLKIVELSDWNNLPEIKEKQLVAFRSKRKPKLQQFSKTELVYATFPEWMKSFNFNGWQERTKSWEVYEIK